MGDESILVFFMVKKNVRRKKAQEAGVRPRLQRQRSVSNLPGKERRKKKGGEEEEG